MTIPWREQINQWLSHLFFVTGLFALLFVAMASSHHELAPRLDRGIDSTNEIRIDHEVNFHPSAPIALQTVSKDLGRFARGLWRAF